jgi:hypothetical protein
MHAPFSSKYYLTSKSNPLVFATRASFYGSYFCLLMDPLELSMCALFISNLCYPLEYGICKSAGFCHWCPFFLQVYSLISNN